MSSRESRPSPQASLGLTSRSLGLGLILVFLVTFLAPPLERYFQQRAQLSAVRAEISETTERIDRARAELERWGDPNFVKAQARTRLHFVLPGETQYVVVDSSGTPLMETKPSLPVVDQVSGRGTWYGRILASIEIAADFSEGAGLTP
jgi:cell division protein FtsB